MAPSLLRREGRRAFGRDPAGYARYRLPYPRRVREILERRCGLAPGAAVFEIGPGPGVASRILLRAGADPLCAIEPDPRLARYLDVSLRAARPRVLIVNTPFEEAVLPEGLFDLGVAATSFHWVNEHRALPKIARLLRPGGWWAMWWNRHGDPERPTEFQRATMAIWGSRPSRYEQWVRDSRRQMREEVRRRLRHLRATGRFDRIAYEAIRSEVDLTAHEVRGLYGTFGEVGKMPLRARTRFLDAIERVARVEFGGTIRLTTVTPIYTARRRPDDAPRP